MFLTKNNNKSSSDFLRSTHNLKKSSSWFVHLLSKRPNHEEGGFFQILCAPQKVRTLQQA